MAARGKTRSAKTGTVKINRAARQAPARASRKQRRVPAGGVTMPSRSGRPAAKAGAGRARLLMSRLTRPVGLILMFLAFGGLMGAGAKAAWSWVTTTPRFAVSEIVIRTGPRVSEREVRTLADLKEGDNIFKFRLKDCVEAIRIHPWVKEASVMRELPNRVVIDVKEREPVAEIALGSIYYVDADGEIFKKVLAGEEMDFPVLTGISLREAVEDKEGADPLIKLGLELIELSRGSRILPQAAVSEVHLDRTYGATLVRTGDGMRIRFGRGEFHEKWRRLERTLAELGSEAVKVSELDLNYEHRVTVKLRDGYRVASQG